MEQATTIRTRVGFAHRGRDFGTSFGQNRYTGEVDLDTRELEIRNARLLPEESLEARGFTLMRHETRVTDFRDQDQLDAIYDQEVHDLIMELTGARKVIVFHNQLRDNSPAAGKEIRKPAFFPHIDYTEETFRIRAREKLGAEADHWLAHRMAAFNIWRGVHPVEEKPLAICDARTVKLGDFVETPIVERPGEPTPYVGMPLSHDSGQRWYYYPAMQPDEALVFKQCDTDHDRIRWSPHVAIDEPGTVDPRPRVSFEARTLAFF